MDREKLLRYEYNLIIAKKDKQIDDLIDMMKVILHPDNQDLVQILLRKQIDK